MSYQIKLHELADEDLLSSFVWYEIRSKGLGEKFLFAIKNKLLKISEHPFRYPLKLDSFRETGISGFPYTIVYFVDDIKLVVIIVSIYHTKRNPKKKFRN